MVIGKRGVAYFRDELVGVGSVGSVGSVGGIIVLEKEELQIHPFVQQHLKIWVNLS